MHLSSSLQYKQRPIYIYTQENRYTLILKDGLNSKQSAIHLLTMIVLHIKFELCEIL